MQSGSIMIGRIAPKSRLAVIAILCLVHVLVRGGEFEDPKCSRGIGTAGVTQCIYRPHYDGKQWATCVTDTYLRQKLWGNIERPYRVCWFPCMLEIYREVHGSAYGSCRCTDDYRVTPRPVSGPATCLSPRGDDCSWYRQCLEASYPCGDGETGYAISYAEKFCNLYNERLSYFTEKGRLWVNAARKCLQVALVHLLRPHENPTCEDIKRNAFKSHPLCYLMPTDGPSFCDLNCVDWAQVFWTIKGAFRDEFVASMKGMVEVMRRCSVEVNQFDKYCPSALSSYG